MKTVILENIQAIEEKEKVVVFYACENGRRAWGFPSIDSDYVVLFFIFAPWDMAKGMQPSI